jgi:hypothetical protein
MHEALEYGCRENFDYLFNLPGAIRPPLPTLIHAALWPDNSVSFAYCFVKWIFIDQLLGMLGTFAEAFHKWNSSNGYIC